MRWLAILFGALLLTTAYQSIRRGIEVQMTDTAENEASYQVGAARHDLGGRIDDLESRTDDIESRAIMR